MDGACKVLHDRAPRQGSASIAEPCRFSRCYASTFKRTRPRTPAPRVKECEISSAENRLHCFLAIEETSASSAAQMIAAARTTTRAVHATPATMVAEASRGVETRARKRKRDLAAQAGVAIPGLPFDVAVSLVEKHLPDPADLAVLRAVSRGMRAAVDATGRKVQFRV